jgi:RHH-type proline utilization regulon transcriptional repressor/proline dehydrogenase/delta 1-pyrroline-5-carboxylate dehydrogenase
MFTGSTVTGNVIANALAQRGGEQVPLIAETGGQNCMIVDSTALPEQVVDDVIASGFQSAGQRCSALRVLFLQEEIADSVTEMLIGALQELSVGDPAFLATDIGPVIDKKALANLQVHAEDMQHNATLLYECKVPANKGTFFAPKLYHIADISVLKREVFGPCVHIVRFKGDELEKTVEKINATGFGLTMGIHTRIDARAMELVKLSRAGNVYVNRNMIGAIVGVQPFGGRGLSGTGPKAGGPNYLTRLMFEKSTPRAINELLPNTYKALQSNEEGKLEAATFMQNAVITEHEWRLTDLNTRLSSLRQLLATIAKVDIVEELADDLNSTLAAARSQLISIERRLKKPKCLPGPTGESNVLYLEPRGVLVCFADKDVTFEYWVLSIVTALATGNVVISVVSELFYAEAIEFREQFVATGAPEGLFQVAKLHHLEALLAEEPLAGVVIDSECERSSYMVQMLAKRTGAILPVITAEYYDNLIQRLLTEKTVSIDTTASGGNTSLMTLVEEEEDE